MELVVLDICPTDYFQGHHEPVLQVPVWENMTKNDFIDTAINEYNMACELYPEMPESEISNQLDRLIVSDPMFPDTKIGDDTYAFLAFV